MSENDEESPEAGAPRGPDAFPASEIPRGVQRGSDSEGQHGAAAADGQPGAATADGQPGDPDSAQVPEAPPPAPGTARHRPARSRGRRRKLAQLEFPILIVIAIAVAVLLKSFVVQPFFIPSASMEKTLHGCSGCHGDRILVFKPVYAVRDPHAGDVVVFKLPNAWPVGSESGGTTLSSNPLVHAVQWVGQLVGVVPPSEHDLVKRVIATAGQTVKCCDPSGKVQISDDGNTFRSLTESYVFEDDARPFGPVTVPKGRLWVMGDHRGDSADSRYHCLPNIEYTDLPAGTACDATSSTVPVNNVIGKAIVIAWPPSRWRTLGTPSTFSAAGLPGLTSVPAEPATAMFAAVALFSARKFPRLRRRVRFGQRLGGRRRRTERR